MTICGDGAGVRPSEKARLTLGAEQSEAASELVETDILAYLQSAGPTTEPEIGEHVEGRTALRRKVLRSLVEQGRVAREGSGRRGDPFTYSLLFSRSLHMLGTREQPSEKVPQHCVNTERILAPHNSEKTLLVSARNQGEI